MDRSYQYSNDQYSGYNTVADQSAQAGYRAGGYNSSYGQSQYSSSTPQIRNPFAPPTTVYAEQNANFDPDGEQQAAQWSAAYAPPEQQERLKKGKHERTDNANYAPLGQRGPPIAGPVAIGAGDVPAAAVVDESKANMTVRRKGGGETWEDKTLLEWDPTQFRIMVGNLAGEVTDDSLAKAFAQYGVAKARVVREKRTTKSKGYGFVSFTDGEQGFKAAREMNGKYIGSHPVTIQRSKTNLNPIVVKDKNKYNNRNRGKGKPSNDQKQNNTHDPLKAHTGAGIEKKPASKPHLKLLG